MKKYELKRDGEEYRVECTDDEGEGQVEVAIFSGPRASVRAHMYAFWITQARSSNATEEVRA